MLLRRFGLIALLFGSACLLFFWNLGNIPLFDPDEGRYSEMALHMVQTEDWMTPRMNGIVHVHKPPLSNWFVALSIQCLGPSEFSTRLPSVLLSLLLLAGFIRLGSFLFGFKAGYYSAWVLTTSALYVVVSRLVTTDMALTFFTFMTMFSAFHFFFEKSSSRLFWFYAVAVFLGLGMLTKGPVAWMITLFPCAFYCFWKKKKLDVSTLHWILAAFISVGLSLSWFIAFMLQNEGAWDYFIHYQLLGRIFHGTAGRANPIFYYLILVPLTFLPWSLFIPSALKALPIRSAEDSTREKIDLVMAWFFIPFILFSLFRTKLATYIVPVFPPLALLIGYFLKQLEEGKIVVKKNLERLFVFASTSYFLLMIGGLVFISIRPKFIHGIAHHHLWLLGALLTLSSVALGCLAYKKKYTLFFKTEFAVLVLIFTLCLNALPTLQFKNYKAFAQKIKELRKPGETVIMFNDYFASVPFYLQERTLEIFTNAETTFEKESTLREFIYTKPESIRSFAENEKRVFILTSETGLERITAQTKQPLYILLKIQKRILLSNQPA